MDPNHRHLEIEEEVQKIKDELQKIRENARRQERLRFMLHMNQMEEERRELERIKQDMLREKKNLEKEKYELERKKLEIELEKQRLLMDNKNGALKKENEGTIWETPESMDAPETRAPTLSKRMYPIYEINNEGNSVDRGRPNLSDVSNKFQPIPLLGESRTLPTERVYNQGRKRMEDRRSIERPKVVPVAKPFFPMGIEGALERSVETKADRDRERESLISNKPILSNRGNSILRRNVDSNMGKVKTKVSVTSRKANPTDRRDTPDRKSADVVKTKVSVSSNMAPSYMEYPREEYYVEPEMNNETTGESVAFSRFTTMIGGGSSAINDDKNIDEERSVTFSKLTSMSDGGSYEIDEKKIVEERPEESVSFSTLTSMGVEGSYEIDEMKTEFEKPMESFTLNKLTPLSSEGANETTYEEKTTNLEIAKESLDSKIFTPMNWVDPSKKRDEEFKLDELMTGSSNFISNNNVDSKKNNEHEDEKEENLMYLENAMNSKNNTYNIETVPYIREDNVIDSEYTKVHHEEQKNEEEENKDTAETKRMEEDIMKKRYIMKEEDIMKKRYIMKEEDKMKEDKIMKEKMTDKAEMNYPSETLISSQIISGPDKDESTKKITASENTKQAGKKSELTIAGKKIAISLVDNKIVIRTDIESDMSESEKEFIPRKKLNEREDEFSVLDKMMEDDANKTKRTSKKKHRDSSSKKSHGRISRRISDSFSRKSEGKNSRRSSDSFSRKSEGRSSRRSLDSRKLEGKSSRRSSDSRKSEGKSSRRSLDSFLRKSERKAKRKSKRKHRKMPDSLDEEMEDICERQSFTRDEMIRNSPRGSCTASRDEMEMRRSSCTLDGEKSKKRRSSWLWKR